MFPGILQTSAYKPTPLVKGPSPGGLGVTPLYKPYRYVPPQRVWLLCRFGLESQNERTYLSFQFQMKKKER